MREIYLDNAATTPMSPKVINVITDEMKNDFGNASSTYELGRKARNVIDKARHQIAESINAKDGEIIFTSGGSEQLIVVKIVVKKSLPLKSNTHQF